MELIKIIDVDEDKCVNCHQCISVCPSKFANDGSGDVVVMNHSLCIGCGQCITACSHGARKGVDDFEEVKNDLTNKTQIIAIVAPAIAASFPDNYLQINGWLKSLGVEAVFDVSFGAELTVKSYIDHINKNDPETVISQPCPAIVTYIQLYQPSLIPHLAPAHSPMMHTIAMVNEFYPKYKDHKVMVVSPCLAKKRELIETNLGDYNVTFSSINKHVEENDIDLNKYDATEFDNDLAERATLFSTPGGLLETAERDYPGIRQKTRKIEGPELVYSYLDSLSDTIKKGMQPLVVDCLNCDAGCNGGTGTDMEGVSLDEMEYHVNKRAQKHVERYGNKPRGKNLDKVLNKYWKPDIYHRTYLDLHSIYAEQIKEPSTEELKSILVSMHKNKKEDEYNCASCGYNSCTEMAKAIHNNLNRLDNCYHYNEHEIVKKNNDLDLKVAASKAEISDKNVAIEKSKTDLIERSEQLLHFLNDIKQLIN